MIKAASTSNKIAQVVDGTDSETLDNRGPNVSVMAT